MIYSFNIFWFLMSPIAVKKTYIQLIGQHDKLHLFHMEYMEHIMQVIWEKERINFFV